MAGRILLTGATGHVGSGILLKALRDGYHVRAAIRSAASRDKILPCVKLQGLDAQLSFIEVPDILAEGAYHVAVQDVDYIIHVASPLVHAELADTDLEATVIRPAVRGTLNMLEAARHSASVQRVVITSSVSANSILTADAAPAGPATREPIPPYTELWTAYRGAKHAALLASDDFMAQHAPSFDLVNVFPASVLGRKEFATEAAQVLEGSNGIALMFVFNQPFPVSLPAAVIHLDDVAHVHVEALKLPGKQNRGFGMAVNFDPNEVIEILEKHFPNAVKEGIFTRPKQPQEFHYINWDVSDTERVFGIKCKGIEEQVVDVARQYLQLSGKLSF